MAPTLTAPMALIEEGAEAEPTLGVLYACGEKMDAASKMLETPAP